LFASRRGLETLLQGVDIGYQQGTFNTSLLASKVIIEAKKYIRLSLNYT
jgi:hypothetical protein